AAHAMFTGTRIVRAGYTRCKKALIRADLQRRRGDRLCYAALWVRDRKRWFLDQHPPVEVFARTETLDLRLIELHLHQPAPFGQSGFGDYRRGLVQPRAQAWRGERHAQ